MDNTNDSYNEQLRSIDQMDMMSRLQFIREIVDRGDYALATEQYVWMWNHMTDREPSMSGVRSSFMLGSIKDLAQLHHPTIDSFSRIRDELTQRVMRSEVSPRDRSDWFALSTRLLEDDECVHIWVDSKRGEPESVSEFQMLGIYLIEWLIEHEDWALAGSCLRSAKREAMCIRHMLERVLLNESEHAERMRVMRFEHDIEQIAYLHSAYLAADREAEAWEFLDELRPLYPEQLAASVCETALRADQFRTRHCELAKSIQGSEYESLQDRIARTGLCRGSEVDPD